jgi:nitrite reductase/ring-hydroxylating ferredoxin subunit
VTTGRFVEDPSAALEMYPVAVRAGTVYVTLPAGHTHADHPSLEVPVAPAASLAPASTPARLLAPDEFRVATLAPGQTQVVRVDGEDVAVYNVAGTFYATQDACTHAGAPLSEGELAGAIVICPVHGSCFDVTTGAVTCAPARKPLQTYQVVVEGEIGRVMLR